MSGQSCAVHRAAVLILAASLVLADAALAQTRSPSERQVLADLAYVLGESHALRQACVGPADQYWRDKMSDLVATERPDPAFDRRLKMAFNAGYSATQAAYPHCTHGARLRQQTAAQRGRDLSASLTGPVAEDGPPR
jgi:uncharacterized protein (TIGR02301 family)